MLFQKNACVDTEVMIDLGKAFVEHVKENTMGYGCYYFAATLHQMIANLFKVFLEWLEYFCVLSRLAK